MLGLVCHCFDCWSCTWLVWVFWLGFECDFVGLSGFWLGMCCLGCYKAEFLLIWGFESNFLV